MGTVGLAAIALILPVYMINCFFAHGLGIGGSVLYSKLLGEGRSRDAVESFNRVAQGTLLLSVATAVLGNIFIVPLLALLGTTPADGELFEATKQYLTILISATPLFYFSNLLNYYLRNDDNGRLAGIGSVVANVADIVLNIVFVLVLGFGTMGAALSTAIGQVIAIAIYMPGVLGRAHILQFSRVSPSFKAVFSVFRDGFSESVNYLYQLIFLLICNNVLIRAGSETAVAVFDMIQNASYLVLYIFEGTNRATLPVVSTYHGEHRTESKKLACRLSFAYGGIAGFTIMAFIAAFPQAICALFGVTGAEAVGVGSFALRIYILSTAFAGSQILMSGYYQASGREKSSLLITSLRGGFVLLPATIVFSLLPIEYFWWLFPVTEIIATAIAMGFLGGKKPEKFDPERIYKAIIRSKDNELGAITASAEEFCEKWEADIKQTYFVTMTLEEVCLAIMQNGYKDTDDILIDIVLVAELDGGFTLHIRDNAAKFDPFSLQTNKASEDDFDMNAMGMRVIKSKAKDFFYRQYGGFNSLVVKI